MEGRRFNVIRSVTIRRLIDMANDLGLTKEAFITIVPPVVKGDEYTLVYYT